MLLIVVFVAILIPIFIFTLIYVVGNLGLLSTYIYDIQDTFKYRVVDKESTYNHKYIEKLNSIGLYVGMNISCNGPITYKTIFYALTPLEWKYDNSLTLYFYLNIESCMARGTIFLVVIIVLLLTAIPLIVMLYLCIPHCLRDTLTCIKDLKKQTTELTKELNLADVKIHH